MYDKSFKDYKINTFNDFAYGGSIKARLRNLTLTINYALKVQL